MLPALRLATNSLLGRKRRTALLASAVAFSTALVAAVACSLASLNAGMEWRVATTLGRADVRVREVAGARFEAGDVLSKVTAQKNVVAASPRLRAPIALRNDRTGLEYVVITRGVDPTLEAAMVAPSLREGRDAAGPDEIVLDPAHMEELGAAVGDTLRVQRFGPPMSLSVVGVSQALAGRMMARPEAIATLDTVERASGYAGQLSEVQVVLREGADAEAAAADLGALMPASVVVEPTQKVTSGIGSAMRANDLMFALSSALAYLASAFIVLTGLTTGVLERQRELAIMRSIGGTRLTMGSTQVLIGLGVGALGAAGGLPLGVGLAWILTLLFPDRLPAGLYVPLDGLVYAASGALIAGALGALWSAIAASRVTPVEALAARAAKPRPRAVALVGAVGLAGALTQLVIVATADDSADLFQRYLFIGLPALFVGYFLLGVPVAALTARTLGPVIAGALRVPRPLLVRSVSATPFRNGFTAGALMLGLAMMTVIWTNGSALLRDWLDALEFPDAFVNGWFGLTPADQATIEGLDFVSDTCAVTLFKIDSSAFGIEGLRNPPTYFVAFEPEPFFAMTNLHWAAGEPEHAQRRMQEGGAVLVAREFLVQRGGYGVGETFRVEHKGQVHEFEIVGAVSSPGLDVVSAYFDIGREYMDQAIGSVFGSRADLQRVFGNDSIQLIQIGLRGDIGDEEATQRIRQALGNRALVVGSGREIKQTITAIGGSTMRIATLIAIAAMLIGCIGVGNVVVAGIDARRFEFGVLRATGAEASLLARLVIAEVLVIAGAACVLGTLLGLQGAWAGVRMYELAAGIELRVRPPLGPILLGWAILGTLTLAAAAPAAAGLARRRPRELLASVRG